MNQSVKTAGFLQLAPFIIFVGLFLSSTFLFDSKLSPIFSCLIATLFSFFTFREKTSLNKKIRHFIEGSSRPTVMTMGYIFIFSSVFSYIMNYIGGIQAAVNIGLFFIPEQFILPGFFIIVSLFAMAIGSSNGTIAAFLPMGVGIAANLGINPAFIAGLVVSGAMFGDNISIISDTTIAATQTTGARMSDKFRANLQLVLPAFIFTLVTLISMNIWYFDFGAIAMNHTVQLTDLVRILPYLLVFVLAIVGFNVVAVLLSGIFFAIVTGIGFGYFTMLEGTQQIIAGFSHNYGNVHELLILSLFIAGLSSIVQHNGGIDYLLDKFSHHIKNLKSAEWSISILTFLVTATIGNNTLAILITGPVAKTIAEKFNITAKRTACLLDIFACICKGMLPYGTQLLLASSIAGVSSMSIIPFLYYQGFLFLVMMGSLLYKHR